MAISMGVPPSTPRLAQATGKQLVFVRYWPRHLFDEWIHNAANPDASRVVFAGDLGSEENEKLRQYYPDRTAWILEPDARPPRLTPYSSCTSVEMVTPPSQPPPTGKGKRPVQSCWRLSTSRGKRGHLLVFDPLLALRKLGGVPFFHFHSSA